MDRKRYSCENGIERSHRTEPAMVANGEFRKIEGGRMAEFEYFCILLDILGYFGIFLVIF